MHGDNTDLVSGVAQLFEHLQTSGGTTAGGTPPPLQQHDPLGAGLVGAESSDDQNLSTSLPERQIFNTVPPVLYASASGQGGVFFYTPSKATSLPGTTVPTVPLFPASTMGTPTFSFGASTYPPKTPHLGITGSPTPIPPLFTTPPWWRGLRANSLPVPRQDFTQAVNAARSVNRFKGDGVTKPDHHLKNFEAVMQAVGILDQALWIIVFKTTLVDEVTSFADDLDKEGVTKWPELKEKFITRYRGAINPVMVMDNLAKVQHKKGEPVLAYVNRFRMEAKWLPSEEANSPMVASLFLRNMQPNISDPCCLQFQPRNCTMTSSSSEGRGTRTPQIVPAVPFCFFCHKSGHTFHQGCPEYAQKFAGYRNQRGSVGQNGNGVCRPAPDCKALTPVLEDSEYNQSGPLEDDKKGVDDTPEVKVNSPQVDNTAAPPRRRGRPRKDKAGPIGGNVWAERKKETQQFAQQIRDQQAKEGIPETSPVGRRTHPATTIDPASSKSEPTRAELGASSTSGVTPSEGALVGIRAVRACYAPPMIPVRIGEITFPRVLVDTGSGVNVMSNQIRIRLGYHRMAPPTTKLAMADNTLVWPLGVLSTVPLVVEASD
ncbi:hypothetical protein R1flu_001306 [Riccia fluitans]|uniref:Retrotransposon gag domain-containing protein n=1 Tax=Riccia fluitans TaxID=41844 RepID=A0ABD1Y2W6_9MARC